MITDTKAKGRPFLSKRLNDAGSAMFFEQLVYHTIGKLSRGDYDGGEWHFHDLSNDGFYMSPKEAYGKSYTLEIGSGDLITLSAEAAGITACLYVFSELSFGDIENPIWGLKYHQLREFMFDHKESTAILFATD